MKISLGECVKFLMVLLQKNEVKLPFRNHESWHRLFYKLKELPEKPDFFNKMRFNWDGNYPKLLELSEFLHSLCVTGSVICDSPQYENYRLLENIFILWRQELEKLDETTKHFIETAADIASGEFTQTWLI